MTASQYLPDSSTIPFTPIVTRTNRKPADVVDEIRRKLAMTHDTAEQIELLELGIDILRRRQRDRAQQRADRGAKR